ncbi:uncharacterized protein [Montipora capricornis]|uniref:uncharacterized protein n=1 Tax=Montipora capricornis TaxID=246305 RepID=UPI0035F20255
MQLRLNSWTEFLFFNLKTAHKMFPTIFLAVLLMFFFGIAFVVFTEFIRVWKNGCSKFHTTRSMFINFFLNRVVFLMGAKARRGLEQDTKNFPKVQEEFLLNILKKNSSTMYGREFKFSSMKNRHDFTKSHPITRYSHYRKFIDNIANGERNTLTSQEPWMLAVTSGTTGKSCLIPKTIDNSRAFVEFGFSVGVYHSIFNALPKADNLQKSLKLFHAPQIKYSEGGIPIGPSTQAPSLQLHALSTPRVHLDVPSEPAGLYIHVLFALKDRDLGSILGNFAYWIHGVFVFLEENWELMLRDLEKGEINPGLDITTRVRRELNKELKPDKERANELRREFEKGFNGIARRIWPNLTHVHGVVTGSSELYANRLQTRYLNGVPICSTIYGATEGLIGVNLWPLEKKPCYVLVPRSMFFEFIPLEQSHKEQPQTLFGEELKVGHLYELVITTLSGLCRYRIGDVIKVVRFHNECPVIEFQYRKGQILNMRYEKMTETMLYEAVTTVIRRRGEKVHLVDYTCAESILLEFLPGSLGTSVQQDGLSAFGSGVKPFYVIFIETEGLQRNAAESEALAEVLDKALCDVNPFYQIRRENGGCIDRIKVQLVESGTFRGFRDFLLQATPTAVNQLKIPRKLTSKEQLKFFLKELTPLKGRVNN